jgi:drug/metabolite transporter (DMT)-like permease
MSSNLLIFLCILLWGISAFLNRLSVERMPPLLMQVIVGSVFLFYIPVALRLTGINNPLSYKWSAYSVILTAIATLCSIAANVLLYTSLKGNTNSGASNMLVSLYPIVTLILSVFILHETFTITKIIGIMVMVVGAYLLALP